VSDDCKKEERGKKAFYEVEKQSWHSPSCLKQLIPLVKCKKSYGLLSANVHWAMGSTIHTPSWQ